MRLAWFGVDGGGVWGQASGSGGVFRWRWVRCVLVVFVLGGRGWFEVVRKAKRWGRFGLLGGGVLRVWDFGWLFWI